MDKMIDGVRVEISFGHLSELDRRHFSDNRTIVIQSSYFSPQDLWCTFKANNGKSYRLTYFDVLYRDANDPFHKVTRCRFHQSKEGVFFRNSDGEIVSEVKLDGAKTDIQSKLDRNLISFLKNEMPMIPLQNARLLRSRESGGMKYDSIYTNSTILSKTPGAPSGQNHSV